MKSNQSRNCNCRVGESYCKYRTAPGKVCDPVEGSITTECGVSKCNRFC